MNLNLDNDGNLTSTDQLTTAAGQPLTAHQIREWDRAPNLLQVLQLQSDGLSGEESWYQRLGLPYDQAAANNASFDGPVGAIMMSWRKYFPTLQYTLGRRMADGTQDLTVDITMSDGSTTTMGLTLGGAQ